LNYPNPFTYGTNILFSLSEDSPVSFEIYNFLGILVQSIPTKDEDGSKGFNYELSDSKRSTIDIEQNNKLEKGLYHIRLQVNKTYISNGVYYMVIRIGNTSRLISMSIN
jgi:hypothetical protein